MTENKYLKTGIIVLLTALFIFLIIMLIKQYSVTTESTETSELKQLLKDEELENIPDSINTVDEYIASNPLLQQDKKYYLEKVVPKFNILFRELNDESDVIIDSLLAGKKFDIQQYEAKLNAKEKEMEELLVNAIPDVKTKDFKNSFQAVINYNKLQNLIVHEAIEFYSKNGRLSKTDLEMIYENNHRKINLKDIEALNFLSSLHENDK